MSIQTKIRIPGESGSRYEFEPVSDIADYDGATGVYAVCAGGFVQELELVDVGISEDLSERLDNHPRKDCWHEKAGKRTLSIFVHRKGSIDECRAIEKDLRSPVESRLCGER